tara:strand:- start:2809 stop:2979 length:171 start_codon:yes stop_codon:yes gene_type:complete
MAKGKVDGRTKEAKATKEVASKILNTEGQKMRKTVNVKRKVTIETSYNGSTILQRG